jgi:hypothetical protein
VTGRAEVARLRQRLNNAFDRFPLVGDDTQVKADFARYLCILLSGFLEQAIVALATEHSRVRSARTVLSYASSQLDRFQNPKTERILTLVGQFDLDWRHRSEAFIIDDLKDAVDSVRSLRNQIAHGENVGVTYAQVDQYRQRVEKVVDFIADLFLPV